MKQRRTCRVIATMTWFADTLYDPLVGCRVLSCDVIRAVPHSNKGSSRQACFNYKHRGASSKLVCRHLCEYVIELSNVVNLTR